MPRKKKDGKFINFFVSTELVDTLDKYTAETGFPKTVITLFKKKDLFGMEN